MNIYADLRRTQLCPFQLFIDISTQISSEGQNRCEKMAFAPLCEVQSPSDWINLEALGNCSAVKAERIFSQLIQSIKNVSNGVLEINVILGEQVLTSDNVYSLLLLAQELSDISIVFHVGPKFNDAELSALFVPRLRQKICFSELSLDSLPNTLLSGLEQNSKSLLEFYKFNIQDKKSVIGFAWTSLNAGASEVGLRWLKSAAVQSVGSQFDELNLLHVQLIRFHSHEYSALAEEVYPDHWQVLDKKSINYLYYLKAYAATLTRKLEIAEKSFRAASINENLQLNGEFSLYQLNIFALFCVLRGEMELAFTLENRIEDFARRNEITSIGLNYVNFINLARLYKKYKDYGTSLNYYQKAYESIRGGGYTASDHIYFGSNLGSLFEASGDYERALLYWVKSALHWLVIENPYALAWRPKILLCQESTNSINKPASIEAISSFFENKIRSLMDKLSLKDISSPFQLLYFCQDSPEIKKSVCYAHQCIVLYGTNSIHSKRSHYSTSLSACLSQVLLHYFEFNPDDKGLVVDQFCEDVFPTNLDALQDLAIVQGCIGYSMDRRIHYTTSSSTLSNLEVCNLRLSPLIQEIREEDGVLNLRFTRTFLNQILTDPDEVEFIQAVNVQNSQVQKTYSQVSRSTVERLLHKKVVQLSFG